MIDAGRSYLNCLLRPGSWKGCESTD